MDDVARRDLKCLRRISRHLDKLSPVGIAWLRSFLTDSYDADGRARYGVKP